MVGVKGYPIKYTASDTVSADSVSIACIASHKIRWRAAPFNASVIDYANNIPTSGGAIDVMKQAFDFGVGVA